MISVLWDAQLVERIVETVYAQMRSLAVLLFSQTHNYTVPFPPTNLSPSSRKLKGTNKLQPRQWEREHTAAAVRELEKCSRWN